MRFCKTLKKDPPRPLLVKNRCSLDSHHFYKILQAPKGFQWAYNIACVHAIKTCCESKYANMECYAGAPMKALRSNSFGANLRSITETKANLCVRFGHGATCACCAPTIGA